MSNSLALYSTLFRRVRQANPKEDPRRQSVFVWLVVGVLLEQTVNLARLANVLPSGALAASRERRLRRWLLNPHVRIRAYYEGLIRTALAEWAGRTVYLALDTTLLAGRLVICRVSLIYRGRAVPLAWQVYEGQSATLAWRRYRPVLSRTLKWLPPDTHVILLADRGFRTTQLMRWCVAQGWHYRIRLKGNTRVRLADGRQLRLKDLHLRPGMVRFLQSVHLEHDGYGPLHVALSWDQTPNAQPWYIATDQAASWSTLVEYGYRMDIDESFRDDKSGGFQLEDSGLTDVVSVSRLLLVLAVATLYLVSVGVTLVAAGERRVVDTHWTRGLSYFQIGWRFLRRCFCLAWGVLDLWGLDPAADPAPVLAAPTGRMPRWRLWLPSDGGP